MNCKKCNLSISDDSKFCSNCGTKIEVDTLSSLDNTIDMCRKIWFMVGFLKGSSNKKEVKTFEEAFKKVGFWEDYVKVIGYWNDFIKENIEKESKVIRPKSKSV